MRLTLAMAGVGAALRTLACALYAGGTLLSPVPAAAQEANGFSVDTYTVTGDNPLDAAETKRILEPFTGVRHGLDDLTAASAALEQALRARGHIFHKVLLPPQTIENATVVLEVKPITINDVRVVGNEHFTEANVRRALPGLELGATPDVKRLARALALANDHPARHLTLNLMESSKPDAIDAEIAVQDQRPWSLFGNFSNIGTEEPGRSRLSVGAQHANLLGFDDALTVVYTTSPEATGDVRQVAVNYRVPTYRLAGVGVVYYAHSDVDSGRIQEVFDVSGAGDFFGGSYSQYLTQFGAYRHQAGFGIDDRSFTNDVSFLGQPLGNDVRSRPFSVNYRGEYRDRGLVANIAFSYALNTGGGRNNNDRSYNLARFGAEEQWDVFRYEGRVTGNLPFAFQASLAFDGQIAGEPLIPGEQFGIGGVNSVRGFEERAVTGDFGQRVSLELWLPPLPYDVRVLGFVDGGHADRRRPQPGEVHHELIASTGVGLRWQWQRQVAVAIDYGHEIEDASDPGAGGIKWHVSLTCRY